MMLTHCGNNVRNRHSGCVFSVKDIVPVPLKTSRNQNRLGNPLIINKGFSDLANRFFYLYILKANFVFCEIICCPTESYPKPGK